MGYCRGPRMVNTFTSYSLITRDIGKSIDRVEKQPLVDRETKYYLENITKVKSIDEFVKNDRLFKYAMKAHGLEDMAYAKAFMVKALKEGVSSSDSFANKLTDKRYAEFVKSYNFAALGAEATTYNKAQQLVTKNYSIQAQLAGLDPQSQYVKDETAHYLANITKVRSVDDLMANNRLYTYALAAYGLDSETESKDFIRNVLEGGTRDPESFANKQTDKAYAGLAAALDFEQWGEAATTFNLARQPAVDKFMRQTLEEDAGKQNEGVRLALYFERKASTISNFYEVLADPALARVVRTYLNLPDSFAKADIDKQVKLFSEKIDIEDFSSPEKLDKFLKRFTSLWEVSNPTSTAQSSVSVLFAQPVSVGMSTDLMIAMQKLRS